MAELEVLAEAEFPSGRFDNAPYKLQYIDGGYEADTIRVSVPETTMEFDLEDLKSFVN